MLTRRSSGRSCLHFAPASPPLSLGVRPQKSHRAVPRTEDSPARAVRRLRRCHSCIRSPCPGRKSASLGSPGHSHCCHAHRNHSRRSRRNRIPAREDNSQPARTWQCKFRRGVWHLSHQSQPHVPRHGSRLVWRRGLVVNAHRVRAHLGFLHLHDPVPNQAGGASPACKLRGVFFFLHGKGAAVDLRPNPSLKRSANGMAPRPSLG